MKYLLSTLRYIFVSPECLVCVAGTAACIFFPSGFARLSNRIGGQAELLKYFGLLPVGLLVYNTNAVKSILMPEADKLNALQSWELYPDFKLGCVIGLAYAIGFTGAGIACLLFDWKMPQAYQSAFLLTSITGALTVSATLYFAHIRIEELFRRHSSPSS